MMRLVVFGTGQFYKENETLISDGDEIVSFIDNNSRLWGEEMNGISVVSPGSVLEFEYDRVLLMGNEKNSAEMKRQLLELGVEDNQISFLYEYITGEKTSLQNNSGDVLIVSPHIGYVGGVIAEVYAAKALQNAGLSIDIVAMGGVIETIREIRKSGLNVRIIPDINYLSEEDYRTLALNHNKIIVNTFQMFRCVRGISGFKKVLWWLHEPSEFYKKLSQDDLKYIRSIDFERVCVRAVSSLAKDNFNKYVKKVTKETLRYGIPDLRRKLYSTQKNNKLVFALIGTVYKTKGQDIFLDALSKLSPEDLSKIEVMIVGKVGNDCYGKEIVKRAAELSCVRMTGLLNRKQIGELEPFIDVYVSASREDSLPIVVTEGLMYGKVCIISTNTGFRDYIEPYTNGLVFEAENRDDLADKISWVIHNSEKLGGVGEQGRKLYSEFFSMKKFEQNLVAALDGL